MVTRGVNSLYDDTGGWKESKTMEHPSGIWGRGPALACLEKLIVPIRSPAFVIGFELRKIVTSWSGLIFSFLTASLGIKIPKEFPHFLVFALISIIEVIHV